VSEIERAIAEATVRQRRALAPGATIWVEASAGTGKTRVLVDRVLTLLLAGAAPERILCLTFTKAAAAEMANRLMGVLADWAALPAGALLRALTDLGPDGGRPDEALVARARALFATVLDAPGGLAIETIHAFCQRLLSRFPLEAGISPGFEVAEERSAAALVGQARAELVAAAEGEPDGELARALAALLLLRGEFGLDKALGEIAQRRGTVEALLGESAGPVGLAARLAALLDLDPAAEEEQELRALLAGVPFGDLRHVARGFAAGSTRDLQQLERLEAFVRAAAGERSRLFGDYCGIFLTKGAPRKDVLTKAAAKAVPEAEAVAQRETERLVSGLERLTAVRCLAAGRALFRVAEGFLQIYGRLKRQRNLLDYADLVVIAGRLLGDPGATAWVHFKLDQGIEHLLIDEAQDTSPGQWAVVAALSGEFYAGEGAFEDRKREGQPMRSVFAVGDAKQSIYRFQGADPAGFRREGERFGALALGAGRRFERVPLSHSFRSVPAVLRAVDAVFAQAEAAEGVAAPGEPVPPHSPTRLGQGGLVELWPLVEGESAPEAEPWQAPTEQLSEVASEVRLAEQVARRIERWLGEAELRQPGGEAWLASRQRPIGAGDILILVRRRNRFFNAIGRALKQRGLPVAGADRMILPDQLAVADLVALGRFLVLPEDDLTLAVVLKGPLFGLDEERLFRLAWRRSGSLWQRLRDEAAEDPALAAIVAELQQLLAQADYVPPFELFASLLSGGGGRRRILARLGPEAGDPLDEFLAQALAYEREHPPSLDGFLHWLERGRLEVKRDLEAAGGAVRVMTVHGAKGLEAPIVFLPDTTTEGGGPETFLVAPEERLLLPQVSGATTLPAYGAALAAELRARREEGRRLLYVALTRASDRLYLCGWKPKRAGDGPSWYALMESALRPIAETVEVPDIGSVCRLHSLQSAPAKAEPGRAAARRPVDLDPWRREALPAEPFPPRPLTPSRPSGPEQPALSPLAAGAGERFRRGLTIHRLLQSLPDLPAEARPAAGRRFLDFAGQDLLPEVREAWLAETLAVMALPEAAPLFGPGSRAEVALSGRVGDLLVAGQVDRLAVTAEAVLLVDYKTNRPPPKTVAEVPEGYWRQMAAYRALLRQVYPGRRLGCFLLWTDGPRLMQLSDEGLDGRLP